MAINTETFGRVLVAHTPEEFHEEAARELMTTLETPVSQGTVCVVAQMDRTETFDSAGLTALLDLRDELRQHGGNLKVCSLTETGQKLFEITRLDHDLDTFDSVIDAVASFLSAG
jgi:anti-sigma B factor antagonist